MVKKMVACISALCLAITAFGINAMAEGNVAKIGDVEYDSLASAIDAIPTDGTQTTVVLIDDATIVGNAGVTISANQNVVLDLNGHTLKNAVNENKGSQVITNKGSLTISDSTDVNKNGTGTGLIVNAVEAGTQPGEWWGTTQYNYATNTITNTGILTVESGKLQQTAASSICYVVDNNSSAADATLNMNGGLLVSGGTTVRMFANSTTKANVMNVTGGIIQGDYTALWIQLPGSGAQKKKAELNVSGGTLKGNDYSFYDYTYGDLFDEVKYTLSGGNFEGVVFSYGANIDITGGTYSDDVAIKQSKPSNVSVSNGKFGGDVYTYGDNATERFISGGVFAINTYVYNGTTYDCDWLYQIVEGKTDIDNTDPETMADYPYTIGVFNVVAEVDGYLYDDIDEALADAKEEALTVVLATDVTVENAKQYAGVCVDLDGNKFIASDVLLKKNTDETYTIVEKTNGAGSYIRQRESTYDKFDVKDDVNPVEGKAQFTIDVSGGSSDGEKIITVTDLPDISAKFLLGLIITNIPNSTSITYKN